MFDLPSIHSKLWRLEFKVSVDWVTDFVALFEDWADSIFWESPLDPEEARAAGIIVDHFLTIQANFLIEDDQVDNIHQKIVAYLSLKSLVENLEVPEILFKEVPHINWLALNYQDFPPLSVGRFFIHGSHIKKLEDPSTISLQIDASTAFGSGKHVTTQRCLLVLDELAKSFSFKNPLDMGCGSGILAIAMAAAWKEKVTAVDIDPEAIRVTLKNASINQLEGYIEGIVSNGFVNAQILDHSPFDLMTANILTIPLCEIATIAGRILHPEAKVILSGIFSHQANKVIDAYKKEKINVIETYEDNEWITLLLEKS